jgi:hypothetical protein
MKKTLLTAITLCTLGLAGCGGTPDGSGNTVGPFNTEARISAYLEGKALRMEGANIPTHPNGISEDRDFGPQSQCYRSVTMTVAGGKYSVVSELGRVVNNKCDRTIDNGRAAFDTTAVLLENVKADGSCFDVTYTYVGFKQVGRGQVSQDGKTLRLELFFEGAASGFRCENGAVGASGVIIGNTAFTGNAVQTYTISTQ